MKESISKTFNYFKVHTQYSICEGAIKIDQLKDFCKSNKILGNYSFTIFCFFLGNVDFQIKEKI